MKKITLLALAIFIIALLAASCRKETPYQDGDRTVIPISLKTVITRVSYSDDTYAFKPGDRIAISSTARPDIEGELTGGPGNWTGSLSYLTDQDRPDNDVVLTATLVHIDNAGQSTYAKGIASGLQDAVEQYSLFTADITFGNATKEDNHDYVVLQQQACFLTATVTFNFENGNFDLDGETTPVNVIVNNSLTISGSAILAQEDATTYSATFVIAMPGGTVLTDESVIQICERDVHMVSVDKTLEANNKYTVSRSVNFKPQLGDPFWSDGTYGRISHPQGVVVTGIIVFVNNYEDSDDSDLANEARALTEKASGFGHALVMSLRNAGTGIKWTNNSNNNAKNGTAITSPIEILGTTNVSGYSNTAILIGNNANTAANTAHNYRYGLGDKLDGTTGWFLPSIGQWVYSISTRGFGDAAPAEEWLINESYKKWLSKSGALSNLVLVKNNGNTNENLLVKSLNDRLQTLYNVFGCEFDSFGMTSGNDFADNYWSSSEYDKDNAIRMNFGSVETREDDSEFNGNKYSTIKTNYLSKQSTYAWKSAFVMKVRPFLAF